MAWQNGWAEKLVGAVCMAGLAGATSLALGGMAELGRHRTFSEAGTALAAGDGIVTIFLGPNPNDEFPRKTGKCTTNPLTDCNLASQAADCSGGTCDPRMITEILQQLVNDINLDGRFEATHVAGTEEITILQGGEEVQDLGIRSTDSGLQFVLATRSKPGQVSVLEVTEAPVTDNSHVEIRVTNDADETRFVNVPTVFDSVTETNDRILSALKNPGGYIVASSNGRIRILFDTQEKRPVKAVSWEDNDSGSGIQTIAAFSSPSQGKAVPALTGWGIALLLVTILGALSLHLIRRKERFGGSTSRG